GAYGAFCPRARRPRQKAWFLSARVPVGRFVPVAPHHRCASHRIKCQIYKAGGVLVEHPPALHGLTRTRITGKFYGHPPRVSMKNTADAGAERARKLRPIIF